MNLVQPPYLRHTIFHETRTEMDSVSRPFDRIIEATDAFYNYMDSMLQAGYDIEGDLSSWSYAVKRDERMVECVTMIWPRIWGEKATDLERII